MPEINLLNPESSSPTSARLHTGRWLQKMLVLLLLLAIFGYGILFVFSYAVKRQLTSNEGVIQQYKTEVEGNQKRAELLTRQGQLAEVKNLIASHQYWSKLLPELSRITLGAASYSSMQVDDKGILNLTVTTSSYSDAEKLLQVFDLPEYNKYFTNVKILSLSRAQKDEKLQVTMRLELTMSNKLLSKEVN